MAGISPGAGACVIGVLSSLAVSAIGCGGRTDIVGATAGDPGGSSGSTGGASGVSSPSGSPGSSGAAASGSVGSAGASGVPGATGTTGSPVGSTGSSGAGAGATGAVGHSGGAGMAGASSGMAGKSGFAGATGTTGSGTTGSSGVAGATGTSSGATATCPQLAPSEELIDNMNDGRQFIPFVNGRAGAWEIYHDNTPGVTMFPAAATFPMSNTGDSCLLLAARVFGGPFVLWGAGFSVGLGAPYNATKYTGISFWGRVGPGSSSVVRVAFPDKDTAPAGNRCSPVAGSPAECFDHFGERVTLSPTWTKYTVLFANLRQDGFGFVAPSFDRTTLYDIQWDIPAGAIFDVWIDNLAFLTQ